MKKDEIYFGKSGLTSTSANHISNMAKQYVAGLEKSLEIKAYQEGMSLIGTEGTSITRVGQTKGVLDELEEKLKKISEAKSLIAWLREAIKARARLEKEVEMKVDDPTTYCEEILGVKLPEKPVKENKPESPTPLTPLSQDDVLGLKSVDFRFKWYRLQTECSVYGKYIHPDGVFDLERTKLQEIVQKPTVVHESGRDTIIYTRTPTITVEEMDQAYFDLQASYRSKQAELNKMSHDIELEVKESEVSTLAKNNKAREEWYKICQKIDNDWSQKFDKWLNDKEIILGRLEEWRENELRRIASLKIIIPEGLKSIYEETCSLGKKVG